MNIQIKGLDRFKRALSNSPQVALPLFNRAIELSIRKIGEVASPITPIDKGQLRQSLKRDVRFRNLYGEIAPRLKYAYKQHEGHYRHNVGERKFLEKGAQRSEKAIKEFFEEAIDKTFKDIKRKTELGI